MSTNDDVVKIMESATRVLAQTAEAYAKTLTELAASLANISVGQPEPDAFGHTDGLGDQLKVKLNQRGVMVADFPNGMPVHLDQDAVNRLAQYLDRYRTDGPKAPVKDKPEVFQCPLCVHPLHGTVQCGHGSTTDRLTVRCTCRGLVEDYVR